MSEQIRTSKYKIFNSVLTFFLLANFFTIYILTLVYDFFLDMNFLDICLSIALSLGLSVFYYFYKIKKFEVEKYYIAEKELTIIKKAFSYEKKQSYFINDLTGAYFSQNFITRRLKIYKIQLIFFSNNNTKDIKFYIDKNTLEMLSEKINVLGNKERKKEEMGISMDKRDWTMDSMIYFFNLLGSMIFILLFLIPIMYLLLKSYFKNGGIEIFGVMYKYMSAFWLIALYLFLALIVLAIILTLMRYLLLSLGFSNFNIKRENDRIVIRSGMGKNYLYKLDAKYITSLKIYQTFFHKIFKCYKVKFDTSSDYESNDNFKGIIYCVKKNLLERLFNEIFYEYKFTEKLEKPKIKFLLPYVANLIIIMIIPIIIGAILIQPILLIAILPIILTVYLIYREKTIAITDDKIIYQSGIWRAKLTIILMEKIVAIKCSQGLITRWVKGENYRILMSGYTSIHYLGVLDAKLNKIIKEKLKI